MFFSKKNKEAKQKLKELEQRQKAEAEQLSAKISAAEQSLKEKGPLLTKGIADPNAPTQTGLLAALRRGLGKTKKLLGGSLFSLASEDACDEDFLEELEERLLAGDVGTATSLQVIEIIRNRMELGQVKTQADAVAALKEIFAQILDQGDHSLPVAEYGPTVYLFVGVNGVGKTTTIGKIASQFKSQGKKVLVAAGDTFRAAAIEQLDAWCKRAEIDIVKKEINSDPSATMFEACTKAKEEQYDILLLDTSGRLHTKTHLMDELSKMNRTIQKVLPKAPHASILVLDANTGQNAILQTREFNEVVNLSGLIVTKLDGTAKGGVVIGIVNEFELPIYYIGVGEKTEDLQPFSPHLFAEGLLSDES